MIIKYKITFFETFKKIEAWTNILKKVDAKDITFIIAGNKFDLFNKNILNQNFSDIDDYCSKEKK